MALLAAAVAVYVCLFIIFRMLDKKNAKKAELKADPTMTVGQGGGLAGTVAGAIASTSAVDAATDTAGVMANTSVGDTATNSASTSAVGSSDTAQASEAMSLGKSAEAEIAGFARIAKKLRIIWAGLGVVAVIFVIAVLYDANTGGHPELYEPFRNILIFNDDWGTYRGLNWRLMFKYMKSFPLFKLLIGTGPETYTAYTISYDYKTMVDYLDKIFDSPHNEVLQYLFTTGILGFLSYYGLVVSAAVTGCRTKNEESRRIASALAFAILAVTLVSFVNVSTPNLTPLVILCLGMCTAAGRKTEQ